MKTKIGDIEISEVISMFLLCQSALFLFNSLVYAFVKGDTEKWFLRCELSMILLGFYGIIKAIQSLKKDK